MGSAKVAVGDDGCFDGDSGLGGLRQRQRACVGGNSMPQQRWRCGQHGGGGGVRRRRAAARNSSSGLGGACAWTAVMVCLNGGGC